MDVTDVLALRFVCECGVPISVEPTKWKDLSKFECGNCKAPWPGKDYAKNTRALQRLAVALRDLQDEAKAATGSEGTGYHVQFEVKRQRET